MHPISLGAGRYLKTILCIGAHCDDIEIGCGGTLLHLLDSSPGITVAWAVLSGTPERAAESRAAAKDFLASAHQVSLSFDSFPDGLFPGHVAGLKSRLVALGAQLQPDLILTHYRADLHQDHRVVAEITWQVFRDHLIWEYEIPKYDGDLGQPNIYVPLPAAVLTRKIAILERSFPSQAGKHWFGAETFRALARLRGIEARADSGWAEAFHGAKTIITA